MSGSEQYPPPYPYPTQYGQPAAQAPPPGFNTGYVAYGQPMQPAMYPPQPQSQQPKYPDQSYAYGQQPQQPYGAGQSYNVNDMPDVDTTNNWAGFADKNIRRMFVQKVYSILSVQLLITFGLTALVVLTPSIKSWVRSHVYLYYVAYIVFLSLYLTLMCCKGPRRNYPTNFILLGLFTFALSYMVAMICAFHDLISVLIAAGITFACCTAVSLLSFWTKFDFTRFGWALLIAVFGLFIASFCLIFVKVKVLFIVYAAIGAIIFMLFLAYDTQLITGGKKYEISPEEYVMGSIMLYIDIVYIFLFILQLVSSGRD